MRERIAAAGLLLLVAAHVAAANPHTSAWLASDAPAPPAYAPAFGHDAGDGLTVDVRPESGASTVFEIDARADGLTLRRARGSGASARGLFGRGWVSDLDARVAPFGGGYAVRRLQGLSLFVPLTGDVFVSLWGEVELLRRSDDGFELAEASGRVLRFDGQGALCALEPEFELRREPGRVVVVGERATWSLTLDAQGRVTTLDAGSSTVRYAYTQDELSTLAGARARTYTVRKGRVTRVADAAGSLLALDYDRRGRLVTLDAGDWRQSYSYETETQLPYARVQTPQGTWTYELLERAWRVRSPTAERTVRFDRRGRSLGGAPEAADPWPRALPGGSVARRTDADGRVIEVRGPGARESLEWDDAGRLLARTSVDGRTTRYGYDAAGRLSKDSSSAGTTHYRYDAQGQLQSVRTPMGVRWSFSSRGGARVGHDGPGGWVRLEREGGRLVRREDASGACLDYRYDAAGRLLEVANQAGQSARFDYDAAGQLERWSGAAGVSRVTRHGATSTVTRGGVTIRTTAVADGERVSTPFGAIRRRRDGQGRVTHLVASAGTFRFEYDAFGQRTRLSYPNGVSVDLGRDGLGRATTRTLTRGGQPLQRVETVWNERHEVVRRATRTRGGQRRVATFAYDEAGRLNSADTVYGSRAYVYDGDGNRSVETRGGSRRLGRFDRRGRLKQRGSERFVHDPSGRLIERVHAGGRDRFGYDGFGRLASVERAGSPRVAYGYDALGRIVRRRVGDTLTTYVYEGERLLAQVRGKQRRVFVYGPELDEPLAYSDGGEWTYLVGDTLHTSLSYLNAKGELIGEAKVGPFGEVAGQPSRPVFFAGRLYDPIARVIPMRARVYDPDLGRFLTPDPSGLAGGINAYAYARNRPLDRCDPLGLWDWVPSWAERAPAEPSDAAADVVSTPRGFLAHTAGFAEYLWEDVKEGRARDRILGTVDAYSSFLTFGLAGTNLSQYANDASEAQRGEAYGEAAGWAFALISGRELLAMGAKGVVNGVRALPQAPGMIMNGAQAAKASAPTWIPRARAALASAPGAAVDGLRWLNANRGPLGASLLGFLQSQGAGVWNVTGRPFVNAGQASVDLVKGLLSSAKASQPAVRTAQPAVKATSGGAQGTVEAAAETVRSGETVGALGRLEGQAAGSGVRTVVRRPHGYKPPGAPAGYQSVHLEPPGYLAERIERTVAAVQSGKAGPSANADDVRQFLHETYEHADEVAALTRALGGASRSIPATGPATGPLRGIHDFGERASVRRVKEFVEELKRKPLTDRDGAVIPVPAWLDDVVREAEAAGQTTVDVGKLSPHVSAGLGRAGPPDPYAIRFHNLSVHHSKAWGPNATGESKSVVEAVADMVAAMRQPRGYRPDPMPFEKIREILGGAVKKGELPPGSEATIERALATQARLERTPGSGVNPYYLWEEGAAAESSAALARSTPTSGRAVANEGAVAEEVSFSSLSAEDQALIRSLEKRLDDETLAYMHVDDGLGIRNNASGESAASLEAISRARENRFLIVDRQGNVVRELQGAESVDFNAPRYLQPGQAFVLQNRSTGVVTVWDTKGVSAEAIRETTKRTLSVGD